MTREKSKQSSYIKIKKKSGMEQDLRSKQQLLWEIENLGLQIASLKEEKANLEFNYQTLAFHVHQLERLLAETNQKLQTEQHDRDRLEDLYQLLFTTLLREKADLEIMLQMTIEHADQVEVLLHNQCIRDPLTGLFNRRYLEQVLEREICRAAQQEQTLGVIMLDVDHFKQLNDSFGHEAGDIVLQKLSSLLQTKMRNSDIACRYGGEEFTLILPNTSLEPIQQQAEYLRQQIEQLNIDYLTHDLNITISLGISTFPESGLRGKDLLQAADAALYRAKAQGRNRVVTAGL